MSHVGLVCLCNNVAVCNCIVNTLWHYRATKLCNEITQLQVWHQSKHSRVQNRTPVFLKGCLFSRTVVADPIQWLWVTCGWVFLEIVCSLLEAYESHQQLHRDAVHQQQHCVRCAAEQCQASFRYHIGNRQDTPILPRLLHSLYDECRKSSGSCAHVSHTTIWAHK